MDFLDDPPCIIGSACRLPGGVLHPDALWPVLNQGNWKAASTLPPRSRGFSSFSLPAGVNGRGGWLGPEGVEMFDAAFFGIPPLEAETLRPNVRLGLELTYEAFENAGIPPSSVEGRNISVSVGVGTEDGWDMKRWMKDGTKAFDRNWAISSDPSGVAGSISHAFNLRGSCNTVSNACASGAFAIRDGVNSLYQDGAEVAIVGSLATHFTPAPFVWAYSTGVASKTGRSSAFSPAADGYSPSEGAVFFILKKLSAAQASGDPIQGTITAFCNEHNGATRTLITPNPSAQIALARRVLKVAKLEAEEVSLFEAHGTGTIVGDALEAEGIRSVFGRRDGDPLVLSSSKSVLGHCHGAAALVGILKVLACFHHRTVPSHHCVPHAEFCKGSIIVPIAPISLNSDRLTAQVNAFGFTGSISSLIVQEAPRPVATLVRTGCHNTRRHLLPFSAKSQAALLAQIQAVCSWALSAKCSLDDLAMILGICRDHHVHRRAFVVDRLSDLEHLPGSTPADDTLRISAPRDVCQSEDGVTAELLNMKSLNPHVFRDDLDREHLESLIEGGDVLRVARLLYERGHDLSFSSVYKKHDINVDVLRSFPFYQFERRRHWTDSQDIAILDSFKTNSSSGVTKSLHDAISHAVNSPTVDQKTFEELIETFGAPLQVSLGPKPARHGIETYFLLTGANGMVGARLLNCLLQTPSSIVYCIVRGEPFSRLCSSFSKHHFDVQLLRDSLDRGSLILMSTTDICGPKLGIVDADYEKLVDTVDEVIHAAWSVNFNLPLAEFKPFLRCTRILAELCLTAKKAVRYHFIGSYASTFNYPDPLVPERALNPRLSDSLAQVRGFDMSMKGLCVELFTPQGYAVSKAIAEHSLVRIHSQHPTGFFLVILRIGQICGDSVTGSWSQNEMMPMMIASLPTLGAFPRSFPPVSWIPSDVSATALCEIVTKRDASLNISKPLFLHIANPHIESWPETAARIGEIAGVRPPRLLALREYVDLVKRQDRPLPISLLLPYFVNSLEDGTMPEIYASLDVRHSQNFSKSLQSCPRIASGLLERIVRSILEPRMTKTLETTRSGAIFLFGPSSELPHSPLDQSIQHSAQLRVMRLAEAIRSKLGDTTVFTGSMLEHQLKTLASQLATVEVLSTRRVSPRAVLGYCFGEYAAAITAGIISEDIVIDILVRRAMSLQGIEGAMLSAFCDISLARHATASMSSPPSLAIIAGPNHIVLSGNNSQTSRAETEFHRRGIKTLKVDTRHPFHSVLMDTSALKFSPPAYTPKDTKIPLISGITAEPILGCKLGYKYWLRHMRDPVDFYGSMQYVREMCQGGAIIDIGPTDLLTKIIARYGWSDVIITAPNVDIGPRQTPSVKPLTSSTLSPRNLECTDDSLGRIEVLDLRKYALVLLEQLFGFEPTAGLLGRSLHSVGLHSLDFIRFTERYSALTGIDISLSAFLSDAPLGTIIDEACRYQQPTSAAVLCK